MIRKYDFYKTKYGKELLIDLICLQDLQKYISEEEAHYLSYFDITFIAKGNGYIRIDESKCNLHNNSIVFSSPGQIRKWHCSNIPTGFALIFEEEFLCSFFNDQQFVRKLSYFSKYNPRPYLQITGNEFKFLQEILHNIQKEIKSNLSKENHMLRSLLYQILIWFDRKFTLNINKTEKYTSGYVNQFIDLVNTNFINHNVVSFYSDKLNITAGHLNDIIKTNLNISAKKYIINRIILEAKRLLSYSDLSISEIAWKLNYQDTSYFTRSFKKATGLTPNQYRKTNP